MKMKTKRKISHILACLGFVMIFIIWSVFMIWWVYPYKTVKINQQPYIVSEKVIKQGGQLGYVIDACNYTDVVPTVNKQFVDGIIYTVPDGVVRLPDGCNKTIVSVKVPKSLPTGEYTLKIFVSYKMNPIRIITSQYQTEKFSVIK
jgi:hypothetical protein